MKYLHFLLFVGCASLALTGELAAQDTQAPAAEPAAEPLLACKGVEFLRAVLGSDTGDAESQYQIGKMYESGRCTYPQDYSMAAFLYREAADQNHAAAEYALGVLYIEGPKGVPKDAVKGRLLIKTAADQGLAKATNWLSQNPG